MKKIMFNDRYGLTQAVLEGRKTMTRRIIPDIWIDFPRSGRQKAAIAGLDSQVLMMDLSHVLGENCLYSAERKYQPKYYKGDEVVVAQPYKDTDVLSFNAYLPDGLKRHKEMLSSPGYRNKMFVKAEYMPYRIRITDIKVERLRDISEEDCIKEGIEEHYPYIDRNPADKVKSYRFRDKQSKYGYFQLYPVRDCFAVLIDRISGKGTWERNPWVYAYEFELIK